MIGKIVNYRGGVRTQYANQMIIIPENCSDKEAAAKLIGNDVLWITPSGKEIPGKVTRVHGRNGAVVAKFERGLPGQAVSTNVDIKD